MSSRLQMRFVVGVFALAASAWAQETRAIISGAVIDPSGAAVPGAIIAAKNLETNVITNAVANDKGLYVTEPINPGKYSVTISKAGFKTIVQSSIELRQADRLGLDLMLELGGTSDTVTVSAEATLLSTAASTQETLINRQLVQDLPTYGDDPYYTVYFTAGVQQVGGKASTSQRPFDGGENGFAINGGAGSNELLLDGSTNTARESTSVSPGIVPPTDAVGEVNVITNLFDAQYGRTAGGVISVSLRSGTNDIHGTTWWFNRNPIFNANTFDSNAARQPIASYKLNEEGTQIQGPVILPKIYNGKNKTFFMYSFERFRDDRPQASSTVTPTALQQVGDFSQTYVSGTSGPTVQIYDPLTTVQNASGAYSRTLFPGGVIPLSRINPIAANIEKIALLPNIPNVARGLVNLVEAPNYDHEPYDVHIFRFDQVLTQKHKLFFTFGRQNRHQTNGLGNDLQGYEAENFPYASTTYKHWRIEHEATVSLTSLLSPSLISTLQLSFNRHQFALAPYSTGYNPTALGFPASQVNQAQAVGFPGLAFTGGGYMSLGDVANTLNFSNNFSARESITKVLGKHNLRFGVEGRDMLNNQKTVNPWASFAFTSAFTQANPLVSASTSGDAQASFLLGYPSSVSSPYLNPATEGQRYYDAFVQDDWRILRKLTLNIGLRWEYESPITDRYNHQVIGFDPTTVTNLGGTGGPPVTGGLLFASSNDRFAYQPDLHAFGPRIGFAYEISRKMVMRGGWGIIYAPTVDVPPVSGYSYTTSPTTSAANAGIIPLTTPGCTVVATCGMLSNPFPTGIQLPTGKSLGLQTLDGQNIAFINPSRVIPHVQSISIGVQYELPWRSVLEVSYNATLGRELETSRNINSDTYQQFIANGTNLTGVTVPNPFANLLPGTSLNTPTLTLQQSLQPYPQFGTITESGMNNGTSNYQALQVRAEKRLSSGLTVLFSSTFARMWTHNTYLNNGLDAPGQFITQIANTQPYTVNLSGSYKLPFFANSKGLIRVVLGGWQASATTTWFSGTLINVANGTPAAETAVSTGINPTLSNPTFQNGFNTCTINNSGTTSVTQNCSSGEAVAWIIPKAFTVVTTPNPQWNGLRTKFPMGLNTSLFKSFKVTERLHAELRAEAFNTTNAPYFGAPNVTPTSSLFGVTTLTQANDPRNMQLSLRLRY